MWFLLGIKRCEGFCRCFLKPYRGVTFSIDNSPIQALTAKPLFYCCQSPIDVPSAMSIEQFFSMGGYAFYVWTSYAAALAVLVINLILPLRRKAEVLKSIERALKRERPRP